MQATTKAAIRQKTLRQAGESIWRMQLDLLFDRFLPWLTIVAMLWLLAAIQWIWLLRSTQPRPEVATAIAFAVSVFAATQIVPILRNLKHTTLARDSGRAVGEYLDRLRGLGYRVFHDIPGDSGNIDHVIISTHGVFTVETRTRSKPKQGPCTLFYDGNGVSMNDSPGDASPIAEARAQAGQLQRLLEETTGENFPVQPIVVYPGWNVEPATPESHMDVWVLSPKALPMWINNQPQTVHGRSVKNAANRLVAYLRGFE